MAKLPFEIIDDEQAHSQPFASLRTQSQEMREAWEFDQNDLRDLVLPDDFFQIFDPSQDRGNWVLGAGRLPIKYADDPKTDCLLIHKPLPEPVRVLTCTHEEDSLGFGAAENTSPNQGRQIVIGQCQ